MSCVDASTDIQNCGRCGNAKTCHERYVVAWSCKGRGFCPSYFGLLSSHAASRSAVVPAPAAPAPAEQDKPACKSTYIPWAELLRKTFGFEIVCEKCHSQLRLIALIKTEAVAKKILKAMHLPTELGPARPAPAPRGFAAPVAELHPARPARPPPGDTGGGDDWLN
jgi:hypothetical protein